MIISVSGQHISIGNNLQEYSKRGLRKSLKIFYRYNKYRYTFFKKRELTLNVTL